MAVDGMTRYFMYRVPDAYVSRKDELTFDEEFICRGSDGDCFIRCEVELPFKDGKEEPLGFIGWVQVDAATYDAYRAYRADDRNLPPYEELVPGRTANPIPEVPDTVGVAVKFKVLPRDPTPYVRWAEPNTPLAALMERGATTVFWHKVVVRFSGAPH